MGFDLVICGMALTDAEMSVIPVMVADRLAVPTLANAAQLRVDGTSVVVRRDTGAATEDVATSRDYPLSRAPDAHNDLKARRSVGKLILDPARRAEPPICPRKDEQWLST